MPAGKLSAGSRKKWISNKRVMAGFSRKNRIDKFTKSMPVKKPDRINGYFSNSASLASRAGPRSDWAMIFPWGSTSTLNGIPLIL